MSTSSLPSYTTAANAAPPAALPHPHTNTNPRIHQRQPSNPIPSPTYTPLGPIITIPDPSRHSARPIGGGTLDFVKQSKDAVLRLQVSTQTMTQQGSDLGSSSGQVPVYGAGANVVGTVELMKIEGVEKVEAKVAGRLKLQEIAEGGTSSRKLCLNSTVLWSRSEDGANTGFVCPRSFRFHLQLPPMITVDGESHPLPPTYSVKLPGLPGFNANVDYYIEVLITRPTTMSSYVPTIKSNLLGFNTGISSVSTPFTYYPRTRPPSPLPSPLRLSVSTGFLLSSEWCMYESCIPSRLPPTQIQNIITKLYLPHSRTFCLKEPIPFHFVVECKSARTLAAYLPYGPTPDLVGATGYLFLAWKLAPLKAEMEGTRTNMWKVDCIGEGTFRHAQDGPTWIAYSGEICLNDTISVGGFKAGGLFVKDFIALSMVPPEPQRAPFTELRQIIPICLATDPWTPSSNSSSTHGQNAASQNNRRVSFTPPVRRRIPVVDNTP